MGFLEGLPPIDDESQIRTGERKKEIASGGQEGKGWDSCSCEAVLLGSLAGRSMSFVSEGYRRCYIGRAE